MRSSDLTWLDAWLADAPDPTEWAVVTTPTDPTTPTWDQIRRREVEADSRAAVLTALSGAMPGGLTTTALIDRCGPCAQARIGELLDLGYRIETTGGRQATYTLADTQPGPPRRRRLGALRVYRWSDGTVEVIPMVPRSIDRATWSTDQVEADADAIRAVLGRI